MTQCKKNVGKGIIAYPCVVNIELDGTHDGPCMANENGPSIHARKAWLAATELEQLELTQVPVPAVIAEQRRQVPHPGAEPLSAFQGPARTSQTGLMEHQEEGISSPVPLGTIDTNAPGQGRQIHTRIVPQVTRRPETLWADESAIPVAPAPVQTQPTKQRPGDQPLPVVNDGVFVQDLVIADFEERKQTGISRYGTPLQTFNGRNVDLDLYEELLDATTYLRQKLEERTELADAVVSLTRLLEANYGDLRADVWDYLNVLFAGTNG